MNHRVHSLIIFMANPFFCVGVFFKVEPATLINQEARGMFPFCLGSIVSLGQLPWLTYMAAQSYTEPGGACGAFALKNRPAGLWPWRGLWHWRAVEEPAMLAFGSEEQVMLLWQAMLASGIEEQASGIEGTGPVGLWHWKMGPTCPLMAFICISPQLWGAASAPPEGQGASDPPLLGPGALGRTFPCRSVRCYYPTWGVTLKNCFS